LKAYCSSKYKILLIWRTKNSPPKHIFYVNSSNLIYVIVIFLKLKYILIYPSLKKYYFKKRKIFFYQCAYEVHPSAFVKWNGNFLGGWKCLHLPTTSRSSFSVFWLANFLNLLFQRYSTFSFSRRIWEFSYCNIFARSFCFSCINFVYTFPVRTDSLVIVIEWIFFVDKVNPIEQSRLQKYIYFIWLLQIKGVGAWAWAWAWMCECIYRNRTPNSKFDLFR